MTIPVIDFSKLDGEERAATLAQIANGCEEWGFFQLVNHGISEELLERVKKVGDECFKNEREENFKNSTLMQSLNEGKKLENVDWEDVFTLLDDNEWPSKTPGFKETMAEYRAELKKLAERVMEVMDENLGLPKGLKYTCQSQKVVYSIWQMNKFSFGVTFIWMVAMNYHSLGDWPWSTCLVCTYNMIAARA